MRITLTIALSGLLSMPTYATTLNITIEIPTLSVAEYHRPYVAIWIEDADQKVAHNLAIWYQQRNGDKHTAPNGYQNCASGGARAAVP